MVFVYWPSSTGYSKRNGRRIVFEQVLACATHVRLEVALPVVANEREGEHLLVSRVKAWPELLCVIVAELPLSCTEVWDQFWESFHLASYLQKSEKMNELTAFKGIGVRYLSYFQVLVPKVLSGSCNYYLWKFRTTNTFFKYKPEMIQFSIPPVLWLL